MENGCAGHVHAQPEVESARWRGQPVRSRACWSGVLQVDVDGAVGILREARPIADAVPIDRVRHETLLLVSHGQRPERVVGRKTARRKVQDVVVLAGERVTPAINSRPPVHRLLRHVHRAGKDPGARGPCEDVVAGYAASEDRDPPVDLRGLDPREDLDRDDPQPGADEEALHQVVPHGH